MLVISTDLFRNSEQRAAVDAAFCHQRHELAVSLAR
jgi:hypothetical protein